MNTEINDNYIFCYQTHSLLKKNIKNIYLFDLDYTLIKTKSGKVFPINKDDWQILYPSIPNILNILIKLNCFIGIITNQKNLKHIQDWIFKINDISKTINFDFIFISIKDDKYRKPMIGSIEFLKDFYKNINWSYNNIVYIGDAFGRKTDHSDTDLKFALNCNFKYNVPEIFFKIKKTHSKYNITYPKIIYFTHYEQNTLIDSILRLLNTDKVYIMMIGFPASGKSFLRNKIIENKPHFLYTNNDEIKNNPKNNSEHLIKNKNILTYNYIIDDNTNLNEKTRKNKLSELFSYRKIGIWFNYNIDICLHLNYMRMYWFNEILVPKVSFYKLAKSNQHINNKDFNYFFEITKVFNEFNYDKQIKYYF